jgi:hypothetical protein
VAPPAEAAVVCLVPSSKIIPLAETLPLTPMPPATIKAPVEFDVDAVVFVILIALAVVEPLVVTVCNVSASAGNEMAVFVTEDKRPCASTANTGTCVALA